MLLLVSVFLFLSHNTFFLAFGFSTTFMHCVFQLPFHLIPFLLDVPLRCSFGFLACYVFFLFCLISPPVLKMPLRRLNGINNSHDNWQSVVQQPFSSSLFIANGRYDMKQTSIRLLLLLDKYKFVGLIIRLMNEIEGFRINAQMLLCYLSL